MSTRFVWLKHRDHGGVQRFPERAVKAWGALGWAPCDPPAELHYRKDPRYTDQPAAPEEKPQSRKAAAEKKEKADG